MELGPYSFNLLKTDFELLQLSITCLRQHLLCNSGLHLTTGTDTDMFNEL